MKKLKSILIIGAFFTLTACVSQPSACFNVSDNNPSVGESVNFTNCTLGASNHSWDFGDGTTSTEKGPTHSWDSTGTYKVTLTSTNKKGEFSESADNIVVD